MPNPLLILVEDPDQLLSTGEYGVGAVVRLQSSATEAGVFADVSGVGSTPTIPIVTLVEIYAGVDPNGTSSSWYRTRYENVGATRVSDWTTAFQVGPEGSGLICSLHDVKRELGTPAATTGDDAVIIEKIRQVGTAIMGYTGRRFVRTPASGTTTFLFDIKRSGRCLRVAKGIAEATLLEVATQTQPETGGTYSTVPAAEWFLRPTFAERDYGWPATEIVISDLSASMLSWGLNAARLTGALGWAAVPDDIVGVAIRASARRVLGKGAGAIVATGPAGTEMLLPDMSGSDRVTLDWYRDIEIG